MKKTAKILVLAATGFEDIELITSVDVFAGLVFRSASYRPRTKS
ncbi:hypothetical protein [Mycoplasma sp. ATU-Cv-508]